MLVDALALLLGDRSDRGAIRTGASRIVVEGAFDDLTPEIDAALDAQGLDAGETVVTRREVGSDGRSRAWVNGSVTTIGVQAEIGALLVDLHAQHQSLELVRGMTQLRLLDGYAGAGDLLREVRGAHARVADCRYERDQLAARRDEAVRRADWLRHVVEEIDAARLLPGEDTTLGAEAHRLSQAGALGEQARELLTLLDADQAGIRSRLGRVARLLEQLGRRDSATEHWNSLLEPAWLACDELIRRVELYIEEVAEDPERQTQVEKRRSLIERLCRKHGGTLEDLFAIRRAAGEELDLIDSATHDLSQLERDLTSAEESLRKLATELSERRSTAALRLAEEVTRLLPTLGLREASVTIELIPLKEVGPQGAEEVSFVARLNPGLAPQPIARSASGGELSRLMLALKVVLLRHDQVATLVFDEIDQGIGGETGVAVGEALAGLARRHQVVVITHLPQIAARADRHLVVRKGTRGGIATSDVDVVHGEDRVLEIARMLGNAEDEAARRLAASLLSNGVRA